MRTADVIIVGGGIVGLATAYRLRERFGDLSVVLIEKEPALGQHQSGRNSGVLHSGIYYQPGSLKATLCRTGKEALQQFCKAEGMAFDLCGKVIVAVEAAELPALERIYRRGQENGVLCDWLDTQQLRALEPFASGVQAIHVPHAGIVDFGQVCRKLGERLAAGGVCLLTGHEVRQLTTENDTVYVTAGNERLAAGHLVNCGGLFADRLARRAGCVPTAKIVPFRGEYYGLVPEAHRFCRGLIYPVPDPRLPFLGVHVTRTIEGSVECGPNAVPALAREGYRWRDVNPADLWDAVSYGGFWKLSTDYWRTGIGEAWRSLNPRAFLQALQRLIPEVQAGHLGRRRAGVRAQAVSKDGKLIDDFLILESRRMIHVLNAPSPAATAALEIGREIVDRLANQRSDWLAPSV